MRRYSSSLLFLLLAVVFVVPTDVHAQGRLMPKSKAAINATETSEERAATPEEEGTANPRSFFRNEEGSPPLLNNVRERSLQLVRTLIKRLDELDAHITASTNIPDDAKENIRGNIADDRAFLKEQEAAVQRAESLEDLRTIAKNVFQRMRERRAEAIQHRAVLKERFTENIAHIQENATTIVARFRTITEKLAAKGVDVTALTAAIDVYEERVSALSTIDVVKDPFALSQAATDLRTTFTAMVDVLKSTITTLQEQEKQ